jgi:hypothetical protein
MDILVFLGGANNFGKEKGDKHMAKDTGKGFRKGAVTGRTQVKNPKTKDFTKRNETEGSKKRGEFMEVKEDKKPFKGVAKEPDKRRK